jgi:protein gp37
MKWHRAAQTAGVGRCVFCARLADVFDVQVFVWRDALMDLIEATTSLNWLLLTKRPQVALKYFQQRKVPDNVWIGTTVENQKMADLRIPILTPISTKVHFLSCEPLLGPIVPPNKALIDLDWVIVGGESGHGAGTMQADGARRLRDQCHQPGIYFFMKQITDSGKKLLIERWPEALRVRAFPHAQG